MLGWLRELLAFFGASYDNTWTNGILSFVCERPDRVIFGLGDLALGNEYHAQATYNEVRKESEHPAHTQSGNQARTRINGLFERALQSPPNQSKPIKNGPETLKALFCWRRAVSVSPYALPYELERSCYSILSRRFSGFVCFSVCP